MQLNFNNKLLIIIVVVNLIIIGIGTFLFLKTDPKIHAQILEHENKMQQLLGKLHKNKVNENDTLITKPTDNAKLPPIVPEQQLPSTNQNSFLSQFQNRITGFLNNFYFVGVGVDNKVYTCETISSPPIISSNTTGNWKNFVQLKDHTFAGVGIDHKVYTCQTISSTPVFAGNPGTWLTFNQLADHTFAGVGIDKKIYTCQKINSTPVLVGNLGNWISFNQISK